MRRILGLSRPSLLNTSLLPPQLSTGLLIGGALCCAAAAFKWHQADRAIESARVELAAAQMLSALAAPSTRQPVASPSQRLSAPGGGAARPIRAVEADRRAVQQFLSVDWNRRLHMVEQAAAGQVNLLGFRLDAQRSLIEMRGEISSIQRFDAFSKQLVDGGAQSVQLHRHEVVRQEGGIRHLFTATAEWSK